MNPLVQFTNDETTRESVFSYLLKALDEHALNAIYNGDDVSGIKNARTALLQAKAKMKKEFLPKETKSGNRAV